MFDVVGHQYHLRMGIAVGNMPSRRKVVTVKRFVGMGDNDIELFFALGGPGLMDEILFERAMVAAGGQGSKSVLYYVNISSGRNSIGGGMTLVALAS